MSFPDKKRRQLCWDSRDNYWKCLDNSKSKEDGYKKCEELKKIFNKECPTEWVTHFNRKYDYLKYKEKIEKEGYSTVDEIVE